MAPNRERRSKVELVRDLLLVLYASPTKSEKPTRLMYGCNMSWAMMMGRGDNAGLLEEIVERELVELIELNPNAEGQDSRTSAEYKITKKGEVVLRFIDALFLYIDEPVIRGAGIPLPLLRHLFRFTSDGRDGVDLFFTRLANGSLLTSYLGEKVEDDDKEPVINDREAFDLSIEAETMRDDKIADLIEEGIMIIEAEADTKIVANPRYVKKKELPVYEIIEKTVDDAWRCPVEGCLYRGYSKQAVRLHIKKKHGGRTKFLV